MNKVKRAVIVAAGIGQRMRPLTLTTPKPLISVNGTRMIDSVIAALHANGITEIHVVVGWLKEAFASAVGLSGGSMAAVTDLGFARALLKALAEDEPERYSAAAQRMEERYARARANTQVRTKRIGKRRTDA